MNIRKLLISITIISFGIPLHGAGDISDIDSLYTMFQNKESAGYVEVPSLHFFIDHWIFGRSHHRQRQACGSG